jgi:hypothetical protein
VQNFTATCLQDEAIISAEINLEKKVSKASGKCRLIIVSIVSLILAVTIFPNWKS